MAEDKDSGIIRNKVEEGYHIIGKKWMAIIVHTLMGKSKRFSEIHASIPDLSKRMLNERMKELEDSGIVVRSVVSTRPVKIYYYLTPKGEDLGAALQTIEFWSETWL